MNDKLPTPDPDFPESGRAEDEYLRGKPRRWPWIVGIVAALFVGLLIGGAAAGTEPVAGEPEVIEVESQDLLDRIAELEAEMKDAQAQGYIEGYDQAIADATAVAEDIVAERDEPSGDYTAGAYVFDDVQVRKDFVDDFEVRARVTNTGGDRDFVFFRVTIFKDGSVVGTADGAVDSFEADATVTVEFISTDVYTDWDEVEFQVDSEW